MRQIPQPDGKIKYLLTERELRRHEGVSSATEVKRLEAINADLLAALECAQVSALKLAHMAFICSAYKGRMNDIRGEVDFMRANVTDAIVKAEVES